MKQCSIQFVGFICLLAFNSCNTYYNLFYTDPTKCFEVAEQKKPYDVIIVPGFPHDSGKVNMVLTERVKWAYFLYKNGYTKNIIFSGSSVHSPYIEAKVMRLLALQLGIKDENIFTEIKAKHTTENMYYSCVMAKELGFTSIAFATEPAQSSFMKPFKRKFKFWVDWYIGRHGSFVGYRIIFSIQVKEIYSKHLLDIHSFHKCFWNFSYR